jgi:Tfp pilus assembly protein PilN
VKSQINLLHQEFRPHFQLVCGAHLISLVVVALTLSSLAYAGLTYLQSDIDSQKAAIKKTIQKNQQVMEELTDELTSRVPDPILVNKLAELKLKAGERSQLLANLKKLSGLKKRSFSTLFDGLAHAQSNKLWLTEFSVTQDKMNVKGVLTQPNALPSWINNLSSTEFFKGQTFNVASLLRDEGILSFELISQPSAVLPNDEKTSTLLAAEISNE